MEWKITDYKMQTQIFFEPHIPTALRQALYYAGENGYVASLPQLLHARSTSPYDSIVWNTWFTSNSEECVVTTKQGNRVVVAVHGGGILATPERFERSLNADLNHLSPEGLTGTYAAKISKREARDILEGKLPDGTQIPVYSFDEFKRGIVDQPWRYAVVLDFDLARKSKKGFQSFDVLRNEPNMIIRAGGAEPLEAYLDKAQSRHNTKLMGNFHPFDHIDPDQPQTRVIFLAGNKGGIGSEGDYNYGYDSDYGIGGYANMDGMARYIAVRKSKISESLEDLDFNP